MLVSENVNQFRRGQDPKAALELGYVNMMPDILLDLLEEVQNTNQILQPVNSYLLNHKAYPLTKHISNPNPLFNIEFGGEGGHGLPENSDAFFVLDCYIDPKIPGIAGSISGQDENGEDFEIVEEEFEPIQDIEISTMAKAINSKALDMIDKSPIELAI